MNKKTAGNKVFAKKTPNLLCGEGLSSQIPNRCMQF